MSDKDAGGAPTRPSWLRAWWPAILWAALVFVLSSMPGESFPKVSFQLADKVVHVGIFGVLSFLCALGLRRTSALRPAAVAIVATLMATGYGVLDEYHQLFTPFRSGADIGDGLADLVGAVLGALALTAWAGLRSPGRPATRQPL